MAGSHPRYRHLVGLKEGYATVLRGDLTSRTPVVRNFNFSFRVGHRNFQRAARILRESPGYLRYRYAYLGSAMCHGVFASFLPRAFRRFLPTGGAA